jgi:asparagine synthase (glutamine-hydrolysing)
MCGIAGFFLPDRMMDISNAETTLQRMSDCISHRGPDSSGLKIIPNQKSLIALAHNRLAVVDLSVAGAQPMTSRDGRFTIIYNGEIYGVEALRQALLDDGYIFRGHSDTEIILEYCARWGIERGLPLFEGMFAFALWDNKEKTLFLARDSAGIKPLYWMKERGVIGFASELKALMPLFEKRRPSLNRKGQLLYAHNGYIPAPYTIYENIYKLPPAHYLKIREGEQEPQVQPYRIWDDQLAIQNDNWTNQLHEVLSESVRMTLNADVPVGCFLSGGVDSSLVTALMQSHSTMPIKTFAIGFEQKEFNEAPYAKAIAQHLGTDHTELIVSEKDMLDVVPMIAHMYDEPFADSSQIPTFLVSRLARKHVTVSLSGDGGDELFSGYGRYPLALKASSIAGVMPRPLRRLLGAMTPSLRHIIGGPSKRSSYTRLLGASDFDDLYNAFLAYDTPIKPAFEKELRMFVHSQSSNLSMRAPFDQKIRAMRRIDFRQYMIDDVLTKVDRASMAVSLESRVPILNQRVIDIACRLPVDRLTDGKTGKIILRDILALYVPRTLFERPKKGFGVPLAAWIRGPLKDFVSTNIETALQADAPFDPVRTRNALAQHLRGERDNGYILWLISTYGDWLSRKFH